MLDVRGADDARCRSALGRPSRGVSRGSPASQPVRLAPAESISERHASPPSCSMPKSVAEAGTRCRPCHSRSPAPPTPPSLAASCVKLAASLRRRHRASADRYALARRGRGGLVVVRKLAEDLAFSTSPASAASALRRTGCGSPRRRASRRGSPVAGRVPSVRCVLRSAGDVELRDEHDPVGGVERRQRAIAQVMLAIEHREERSRLQHARSIAP